MMKQSMFEIREQQALTTDVFRLLLQGDTSAIAQPGQFVNIRIEGFYLRRPISVCDWEDGTLTLLYKLVGRGTHKLSRMPLGTQLDVLTGLGNGYDMDKSGQQPLLIGGGVGIPPLYGLAKRLRQQGKSVQAILGFNSAADIFYAEAFRNLGVDVRISTVDGSSGVAGFVTDALPGLRYSYVYSCGPLPMLQAVSAAISTSGQFSLEERMGCGFGACMGCSCQTTGGSKRLCKDGPVLEKEEIIW